MADSDKRVRYYTGQFLQKEDFIEEQAYHIDRLRRHLRQLHTFGIAEGLTVTANVNDSSITVQPGTAIDNKGRPIVLAEPRTAQLPKLTDFVLVVISYQEEQAFPAAPTTLGDVEDTRWLEVPDVDVIPASSAPPADVRIQLAKLQLANGKIVEPQDTSVRTAAGPKLGPEIAIERFRLKRQGVPSDLWPVLSSGAPNQADVAGNLTVTGNLNVMRDVLVTGTVDGRDVSADGARLDRIERSTIKGVSNPGGNIDLVGQNGIVITGDDLANKITFSTSLSALDGLPSSSYLRRALRLVVFSHLDAHGATSTVDIGFQPKFITMEGTFLVDRSEAQGGLPLPQHLGGPIGGFCLIDETGNIQQYGHGPAITHGYTNDGTAPVVFSTYNELLDGSICFMACYHASPSSAPHFAQAVVSIDTILPHGFRVRLEKDAPGSPYEPASFTASMIFAVLG